jgi:hypothetical protein
MPRKHTRPNERVSRADAERFLDYADPKYLYFRSVEVDRGRAGERLIDEAERIRFMKRLGLTIPQIAGKLATEPRSVRKRLQLLRLTSEGQRVCRRKAAEERGKEVEEVSGKESKTRRERSASDPQDFTLG